MSQTRLADREPAPAVAALLHSGSGLAVEVVGSLDVLEAIVPAWRVLQRDRQVFVGPEWTRSWLEGPGAKSRPHVLVAREAGVVVGVLPLAERRGVLSTCGALDGLAHVDVVATAADAPLVADAFASALLDGPWSRLRLHRLAHDGALLGALRGCANGRPLLERFATACPSVDHDGDWDSFLRSLSKHHRHEVTRQLRRFWEGPDATLRWVTEPGEVDAAMDALFDLHARRFAALGRETALCGPTTRTFHGTLARRLAENGQLMLGLLCDSGRPVAAAYGFHLRGTTSFFNAGIDPAFQRAGAGVALRAHVLKDAVLGGGRRELDLLEGCQDWKLRWATGVRPLIDVDVFPSGIGGRMRGGVRALVRTLRRKAASTLRGDTGGPGMTTDEPADPKHCRRLGCPYAPTV